MHGDEDELCGVVELRGGMLMRRDAATRFRRYQAEWVAPYYVATNERVSIIYANELYKMSSEM